MGHGVHRQKRVAGHGKEQCVLAAVKLGHAAQQPLGDEIQIGVGRALVYQKAFFLHGDNMRHRGESLHGSGTHREV